ncbi:MAG: hypothetical protein ACRCV9_08015 [Burkholderiaceae bacterium]
MILVEMDAYVDPITSAVLSPLKRWSDAGYQSLATDSPAYDYWESRLKEKPSWRRGGQAHWMEGVQSGTVGTIELENSDGGLDALWSEVLRGRRIRVWIIEAGASLSNRVLLHTLYADRIEALNENMLTMYVFGPASKLEVRLTDSKYSGTGTVLDGSSMPYTIGRCLNVPAQLYDPANLMYRVHANDPHLIEQVLFNGDPIPPGDWTSAAGGFQLLVNPIGKVTADVRGEPLLSSYIQTFTQIVDHLFAIAGVVSLIDTQSLIYVSIDLGATQFGLFEPKSPTVASVLTALCNSVGAWWYETADGKIGFARLKRPQLLPAGIEIRMPQLDKKLMRFAHERAPGFSTTVLAQKNWYVHGDNDLAGSAPPTLRQDFRLIKKPTVNNTGPAIAAHEKLDFDGLPTLIQSVSQAQSEADHRGTLYPGNMPMLLTVYVLLRSLSDLQLLQSGRRLDLFISRLGMENGVPSQILFVASSEKDDVLDVTVRVER